MTQIILLTKGETAIIDDVDFSEISKYKWCLHETAGKKYAKRAVSQQIVGKKHKTKLMHQQIIKPSKRFQIDHINGNGLDNRRENLRIVTHQQNLMNQIKTRGTSQFKGVTWDKLRVKWNAKIKLNRKTINLGRFDSEQEAALAYDKAAKNLFGEYAKLNMGVPREWI